MKKILALLLALVMLCSLAACGAKDDAAGTTTAAPETTAAPTETEAAGGEEETEGEVMAWTVEACYNSDTVNQWKTIYLIDEDNYVITVYALDSQDPTKVTADYYMAGKYTLDGNLLTVNPGYGFTSALNGDTPIEMTIAPAEDGTMNSMYYAMIGMYSSITLNEDGTWEGVE